MKPFSPKTIDNEFYGVPLSILDTISLTILLLLRTWCFGFCPNLKNLVSRYKSRTSRGVEAGWSKIIIFIVGTLPIWWDQVFGHVMYSKSMKRQPPAWESYPHQTGETSPRLGWWVVSFHRFWLESALDWDHLQHLCRRHVWKLWCRDFSRIEQRSLQWRASASQSLSLLHTNHRTKSLNSSKENMENCIPQDSTVCVRSTAPEFPDTLPKLGVTAVTRHRSL